MPSEAITVSSAQLYPQSDESAPTSDDTPEDDVDVTEEDTEAVESHTEATEEPLDLETLLDSIPSEEDETESADVDTSTFDAQFSKRFGMTPDEATQLVTSLQEFRQRVELHEQKLILAQHWGIDIGAAGQRLETIKKAWDKLPADAQSKLDNVDGAIALWAQLEGRKKPSLTTTKAPSQTKNRAYDFTMREIRAMSPKEYAQRVEEITRAFNTGRVNLQIK
jgi:hypothetical protein